MTRDQQVTVISRNYDLSVRRTWKCRLVEVRGSLLSFVGKFDHEITHSDLGVIKAGTVSHEYYWLDRWYNVFRFDDPAGALRNYYCNITMPPKFENRILDYVDLDIDILVSPQHTATVLDIEEFEENAVRYEIPDDVLLSARQCLKDLLKKIERREFPFDQR
jgi:protein associated with RNAse G/E